MTSKSRITVNLSEEEYKGLLAISQKHQISMAWLGRQAITQMLDKYQDNTLQLPLNFIGEIRRSGS
jgi:hypothetical protein